jgi:flavin-dependent dehydrogenase
MTSSTDYDFVIVGARCAGAGTAHLLARAGARVLVLERGTLGADTLSTSYLMRAAVLQLRRWGVLPQLVAFSDTPAVRTTHFHYAQSTVSVDVRPADGVDALYAPRRTVLDPLLVSLANKSGAELRFGARVTDLSRDAAGRVTGVYFESGPSRREHVRAHMVIGADGLRSSVATAAGAPTYRTGHNGPTTIYGYVEGLAIDSYHWYYAHGLTAGAAPTNDGLSTVFVAAPSERVGDVRADRRAALLRMAAAVSPRLAESLGDLRFAGALRVFPGMPGYYRKPWGSGWALVGDAGYFRDPNTAHGISDALRDAELLARALLRDTDAALADYHATRDAVTERLFQASDEIGGGLWDDARIGALLREASEGMRDGLRVVQSFDAEVDQPGAWKRNAAHTLSNGKPASRLCAAIESSSEL